MRNCLLCSQPASLQHLFLDCTGGHALEARLASIGREVQLWSRTPGEILRTLLFQKPHLALDYLQQAGFLENFSTTP